jgi:hypothetical protein
MDVPSHDNVAEAAPGHEYGLVRCPGASKARAPRCCGADFAHAVHLVCREPGPRPTWTRRPGIPARRTCARTCRRTRPAVAFAWRMGGRVSQVARSEPRPRRTPACGRLDHERIRGPAGAGAPRRGIVRNRALRPASRAARGARARPCRARAASPSAPHRSRADPRDPGAARSRVFLPSHDASLLPPLRDRRRDHCELMLNNNPSRGTGRSCGW